jgi:hypothetical protein
MDNASLSLVLFYKAIIDQGIEGMPDSGTGDVIGSTQFIFRWQNIPFPVYPIGDMLSQDLV